MLNNDELIEIKNTLIEKKETYVYDILIIYLEHGYSSKFLSNLNVLLKNDRLFYEMLQYSAFLNKFNLDEERDITQQELMTIDICALEYDEDTEIFSNNKLTEEKKFEIYKDKFLN